MLAILKHRRRMGYMTKTYDIADWDVAYVIDKHRDYYIKRYGAGALERVQKMIDSLEVRGIPAIHLHDVRTAINDAINTAKDKPL